MKANRAAVAAAIIAIFTTEASAHLSRDTAMPADEGVPHNLVSAAEDSDRVPEHREEAPKHLV